MQTCGREKVCGQTSAVPVAGGEEKPSCLTDDDHQELMACLKTLVILGFRLTQNQIPRAMINQFVPLNRYLLVYKMKLEYYTSP